MGKFSGILLCSDFDGTLAVGGRVVERNIEAIRYFQENGGLFSIITGRTPEFIVGCENEVRCNTFVGCLNGTIIYDYLGDRIVCSDFVKGDLFTPLMKIHSELDIFKNIVIFHGDGDALIEGDAENFAERLRVELDEPVLKVIIRAARPYTEEELDRVSVILGDEFEQARSWSIGLEIQNRGNNKGKAARKIAELAGAKTLVCVGDYENDISLLEAADISFAVDNAIPSLKAIAHRQTVAAEDGAIARIIDDLLFLLEKKK